MKPVRAETQSPYCRAAKAGGVLKTERNFLDVVKRRARLVHPVKGWCSAKLISPAATRAGSSNTRPVAKAEAAAKAKAEEEAAGKRAAENAAKAKAEEEAAKVKAEKEAAFAADEMVKKLAEPAPTDPELPNASATTAVASGDTNGALGVLVLLAAILVFVAAAMMGTDGLNV